MAKGLHQRISLFRQQSGKSEHRARFILPARGASHIIKGVSNVCMYIERYFPVVLFFILFFFILYKVA